MTLSGEIAFVGKENRPVTRENAVAPDEIAVGWSENYIDGKESHLVAKEIAGSGKENISGRWIFFI